MQQCIGRDQQEMGSLKEVNMQIEDMGAKHVQRSISGEAASAHMASDLASTSTALTPAAASHALTAENNRPLSPDVKGKGKAIPAQASGRSEETKLYVGNLAPSCDEYTLVQLFSRYGKITKLDYLFHTSGPQKGKPRGFAFVEFGTKEETLNALVETNDKLIRGRRLTVSLSTAAPSEATSRHTGSRKKKSEPPKPTLLSLQKQSKASSTDAKIRALEAKLSKMKEDSTIVPRPGEQGSTLDAAPSSARLPIRPSQTYKAPSIGQAALSREEAVEKRP